MEDDDLYLKARKLADEFEEFDGQFIHEGCLEDQFGDLMCIGQEYRVNYKDRLGGVTASVLIGFKEKANGLRRMIFVPTTGDQTGLMFEALPTDEDVFLDSIPENCQLNPELTCSEEDQDVSADQVFYNQFVADPMSFYTEQSGVSGGGFVSPGVSGGGFIQLAE